MLVEAGTNDEADATFKCTYCSLYLTVLQSQRPMDINVFESHRPHITNNLLTTTARITNTVHTYPRVQLSKLCHFSMAARIILSFDHLTAAQELKETLIQAAIQHGDVEAEVRASLQDAWVLKRSEFHHANRL